MAIAMLSGRLSSLGGVSWLGESAASRGAHRANRGIVIPAADTRLVVPPVTLGESAEESMCGLSREG